MKEFSEKPCISAEEVQTALSAACAQVKRNIPFFTGSCQNHSSVNGFYPKCENNQWTCGFWPGEIWLSYEHTGDAEFRGEAERLVQSFYNRIVNKIEVDHHDMGFLYSPSCVAAYKLTGNETAKKAAIMAADQLISRFQPKGGFIQAWGKKGEKGNYRYIIDCLLNLPLLYWASETTGDAKYSEIANTHIRTCLKNSFRDDFSTYHTFFMNQDTGEPDHGATCQGYKDDSFWARGQAWAIYGIALAFKYVKTTEYLTLFDNVSAFFLERLPKDFVPYWDLVFADGSNEPRDSSSAAIAACGFLQMADNLDSVSVCKAGVQNEAKASSESGCGEAALNSEKAALYRKIAAQIMKSLCDSYAVKDSSTSNGLLLHGTYSKKSPYNTCTEEGVDECVSWGDYFYMEALTRLSKKWNPYW